MNEHLGLKFLPTGTPEGFASKAVSSDNDANPSVIVRELIQNSLDAGTPPGSQVKVEFIFDQIEASEIPGINEYKKAFAAARSIHASTPKLTPEAVEAQLERIGESLAQDQISVLCVLDNGIGLDSRLTNSLLSDGLTNKIGEGANSAGSYGLGHYTAFPASDLQYVVYGGVTESGARTMSGHAILASHFNEKDELLGKDGYFISGSPKNNILDRYNFPSNGSIPPMVDRILDDIRKRFGRGSAVILLAFNDFRGEADPVRSVLQVASRHFYPVIKTGNLVVRAKRNGDEQILDESVASQLLESGRKIRRSRSDRINGSKAYAIWRTINFGTKKDVETDFGKVRLYLRLADEDESTKISLFRSGMFITDSIPMLYVSNFSEYRRFSCVILIDTPSKSENASGFGLIRQAEGEKHASIDKKRLPSDKRTKLDDLLSNIRDAIKGMATKDDSDTHVPEGFMELELTADAERMNPRRAANNTPTKSPTPREFTPLPEEMKPVPDGPPSDRPNPSPKPRERVSNSTGRRVFVSASARRFERRVRLVVRPTEDISNATLRLLADQGADASCTNPLADEPIELRIAGKVGEFVQELVIGQLQKGKRYEFDVDMHRQISDEAVLKVDVISRKVKTLESKDQ